MPDAITTFRANMADADALTVLFDYLTVSVGGPVSFDDLLRAKIVYAVGAFDKLIHDIVRQGMVETFSGNRKPTPKYLSEPIPMSVVQDLLSATTPPREVLFDQAVRLKLKSLAFQDPDKVSDGLAYVWDESQKWRRIAAAISEDEQLTRKTLKLIAARRNAIVHEADVDPISEAKTSITRQEVEDVGAFLRKVGEAIFVLTR